MTVQHREWNGPSLVHVIGELITHPVQVKEIGDFRVFCVCDDRKPDTAWVIADREVMVKYDGRSQHVMVPALLLVPEANDDWALAMSCSSRQEYWQKSVLLESEDSKNENNKQ